ncbi:MAG: hypothetical protein Q8R13_01885, partial [bacterium]|nr:hypothetical protein [bacterium]
HLEELRYRIKEQRRIIKEKDFVVSILAKESPRIQEVKKVRNIVTVWLKNHIYWLDLLKQNKKWSQQGGSATWHRRWIKTYAEILSNLDEYAKLKKDGVI